NTIPSPRPPKAAVGVSITLPRMTSGTSHPTAMSVPSRAIDQIFHGPVVGLRRPGAIDFVIASLDIAETADIGVNIGPDAPAGADIIPAPHGHQIAGDEASPIGFGQQVEKGEPPGL